MKDRFNRSRLQEAITLRELDTILASFRVIKARTRQDLSKNQAVVKVIPASAATSSSISSSPKSLARTTTANAIDQITPSAWQVPPGPEAQEVHQGSLNETSRNRSAEPIALNSSNFIMWKASQKQLLLQPDSIAYPRSFGGDIRRGTRSSRTMQSGRARSF